MRNKYFILALTVLLSCSSTPERYYNHVALEETDTLEDIIWKAAHVVPSDRQFEWQRLELTAFAHFGLNTFSGMQWGSGKEDPALFNPTDFDAWQWVDVLKKAGFKSLLLTCKHHDGFCLWPSAYTDYSVIQSPWKDGQGDVVREVADACHEAGLKFGIYLSPWDRHEQSYGTAEYNDYFVFQLTELLTGYGTVDEVWFDGACGEGPNGKRQEYDFDRWYRVVRALQPQAVIAVMGPDVRWVGNERGRARETEWSVVPNNNLDPSLIAAESQHELIMPPTRMTREPDLGSRELIRNAKTLVWYPAESDVSIRPGWFYNDNDAGQTKTPEQLIDIYFKSVGRNSNLMLNIPPNKEGRFGDEEVESLLGFARLREKIFETNLIDFSEVTIDCLSPARARMVCDGNYDTGICLDKGQVIAWKWQEAVTFSIFLSQEDIRKGQRVESFSLEYKTEEGTWATAAEGSTIGYKRLLHFEPVTTNEARMVIHSSRLEPFIAETGLY